MKLYNTLTRSVEPFTPLAPPLVTMYVCGPTVYDDPHLGHARSAYVFDVLRRHLASQGFQVQFVRNVTDVDDKIIQKAHETGESCEVVAARYLKSYHDMLELLGIPLPTEKEEPRATQHVVPEMTDFIAKLLMQGAAYEAGGPACRAPGCRAEHGAGRDVYFAVRKFPGYGTLSNRALDDMQAGSRVEPGEHKRDPLDFALWKAAKPGEPSWNSPWGTGRPGWHIECSAMSTKYLGDTFDIHGGGVDLVFPHHENEVAQAHAAGKPFARWWVHNGLLTVNGEKMSKSLKNYITVEQVLQECWGGADHLKADVLKAFFLGTHYRSPADYTPANIKAAGKRFQKLFTWCLTSKDKRALSDQTEVMPHETGLLRDEFERAMEDDLNTPRALATLDKLANLIAVSETRLVVGELHSEEARIERNRMAWAGTLLERLGGVLGLVSFGEYGEYLGDEGVEVRLTPEQEARLTMREEARKRKDFKTADTIRKQFEAEGLLVKDTAKGPTVRKKR